MCRPYRAQTKGKVESGVKYMRRNFLCGLQGREPIGLEDFNAQLRGWVPDLAAEILDDDLAPALTFNPFIVGGEPHPNGLDAFRGTKLERDRAGRVEDTRLVFHNFGRLYLELS